MNTNDLIYSNLESLLFQHASADAKIVLAYSGGVDSEVLAYCLSIFAKKHKYFSYLLVHVNHSLSPNSDSWVKHCLERAKLYDLPIAVESISINKRPRSSIEELARDARYKAIFKHLDFNSVLLTAHHEDDQLESVLLALKRGSGSQGLAGISQASFVDNNLLLRPFLSINKKHLSTFAAENNIIHVV